MTDLKYRDDSQGGLNESSTDEPAISVDFYEDIPAIAAILDERGIILSLSREATARFGANAPRFVGRSILSLAHRDDRTTVSEAIQAALSDRSCIAHCEFRVWRGARPALMLRTSIRAATQGSGPAILLAVASDMTDKLLLERQLLRRSAELSEMANRLVVAQNEERRKVAADMHDGVGHSLALAKFHIDGLKDVVADDSGREAVATAATMLQDAIDAVRSLTFALTSVPLHDRGLDAAIEELGQSLSRQKNLQFSLSSRPRSKRLNQAARLSLYRIVRELLVNVIKHARASNVRVSLGADDTHLHVAVVDDGVGIGQVSPDAVAGNGLRSIDRQVQALDGKFVVAPRLHGGTSVRLTLPFTRIGESP